MSPKRNKWTYVCMVLTENNFFGQVFLEISPTSRPFILLTISLILEVPHILLVFKFITPMCSTLTQTKGVFQSNKVNTQYQEKINALDIGGARQPDPSQFLLRVRCVSVQFTVARKLSFEMITCLFLELLWALFLSWWHHFLTRYQARKLAFILSLPTSPTQTACPISSTSSEGLLGLLSLLTLTAIIMSCLDNFSSFLSLCLYARSFLIPFPQGGQENYSNMSTGCICLLTKHFHSFQ